VNRITQVTLVNRRRSHHPVGGNTWTAQGDAASGCDSRSMPPANVRYHPSSSQCRPARIVPFSDACGSEIWRSEHGCAITPRSGDIGQCPISLRAVVIARMAIAAGQPGGPSCIRGSRDYRALDSPSRVFVARGVRYRHDASGWIRMGVVGVMARLGSGLLIVKPATVIGWHRRLVARHWAQRSSPPGRPSTRAEARRLVLRLGAENPCWVYRRIHGELCGVGYRVTASTVWSILNTAGRNPTPDRTGPSW
jgi:hypothetical protein